MNDAIKCQSYQNSSRLGAAGFSSSKKDIEPLLINNNDDDLSLKDIRVSNNHVLGIAFYSFLGFTIVQTTFAFKAKSSAMIADSMAMFVDSATYLFNMIAERLKCRELSDEERKYPAAVLEHKLKLQRNYLELIPPFISVTTLLYVTVVTFGASIRTLTHSGAANSSASQGQPNVTVMMVFSLLNLLLDILNVTCFARVNQAIFSPPVIYESSHQHNNGTDRTAAEDSPLLLSNIDETLGSTTLETSLCEDEMSDGESMNLNMCSAWTVSSIVLLQLNACCLLS
jgi:Co/Zn/Cd efflux system component